MSDLADFVREVLRLSYQFADRTGVADEDAPSPEWINRQTIDTQERGEFTQVLLDKLTKARIVYACGTIPLKRKSSLTQQRDLSVDGAVRHHWFEYRQGKDQPFPSGF